MELRIIYEDKEIFVVDKPAGVVVEEYRKFGFLAHRLDRDTSGVMVVAKTSESYESLKMQFLERKVTKKYLALVHGSLDKNEGIISAPVERSPGNKQKFTVGEDLSRTAITDWKVISNYPVLNAHYSLLELTPHTGRTHQIRVHLKFIGRPIVGDPWYAGRKVYKEDVKWCPRMFLHAKSLEFGHPRTGKKVKFESELPMELKEVIVKRWDQASDVY